MSTRQQRNAGRRQQRNIRNLTLAGGAIVLLIALAIVFDPKAFARPITPAQVGQPLSQFSLQDVNGDTVRLEDYQGKVVLVNAWATWCPPCKAEMPDLNAFYQKHRDEGFELLAVNAGDTASQAAAFAQQANLAFPILLDSDLTLLNSLGIHSYPTSIVVGRDGVVKTIHLGMYSPASLEAEVTPLLGGQ